jgi:hypothetical protein
MTVLLAFAIFVQATGHQCRVPRVAFQSHLTLTRHEIADMERFGHCLCGLEGTVDYDPRPHRLGGYFMHPSCNRNGWDGRRYRTSR